MRLLICTLFIITQLNISAQDISIIPQPKNVTPTAGYNEFHLNPSTRIVLEGTNLQNSVDFLNDYLNRYYSISLKTVTTSTSKNVIRLNYEKMEKKNPGAYRLEVNKDGIYIAGDNETGIFYGIQS